MKKVKLILFLFTSFLMISAMKVKPQRNFDNPKDEALYDEAVQQVIAGDYYGAIENIEKMKDSSGRNTQNLLARAYAGRCGHRQQEVLDFMNYKRSGNLFKSVMREYNLSSGQIHNCIKAESILRRIGDAQTRTPQENKFLATLELVKIGKILSYNADSDSDGQLDGGFDACSSGSISDENVKQLGIALNEFSYSAISIGEDLGGVISSIANACNETAVLGPQYDFCDKLDMNQFDEDNIKAIRTFIAEEELLGLGSCESIAPSISNCLCP